MIFQNELFEQKNLPYATSLHLPSPGVLVASKYRIERLLDCGSMGAVFRAQHEEMQRAVALKFLLPRLAGVEEYRERFISEARAAARVRHPNVVHIYDLGEYDGLPFLVMELLEGQSLDVVLASGLPIADALQLVMGAMRGLAAAHAHKIVHRDVKPENIFVVNGARSGPPVAKILDFGISKRTDGRSELQSITGAGKTMGTPHYMSLEQLNGAPDIDARTDIYSFGVIVYQVLTQRYPFDADNLPLLADKVAHACVAPPSELCEDIPVAFDAVVMKALASDRAQRYSTLDELVDALEAVTITDAAVLLETKTNMPAARTWIAVRVLASVVIMCGLLAAAAWPSLHAVPSVARERAQAAAAPPPPAAPLQLEVEPLLPPSANTEPRSSSIPAASQYPDPRPRPKPHTSRSRRVAKPAQGTLLMEAPSAPDLAHGQRSGTLRRDAL